MEKSNYPEGLWASMQNAICLKSVVCLSGKTAPEITGEDIAGIAFNLSDYRGKFVLLDFWGHW